ncbi:MAG: hypothetical protein LBJ67_13175 [Planctomycetaceae bacterium]|jgi:hypothetical protein|nr:hypothetical protein [Planctomycetaceae bacterium]
MSPETQKNNVIDANRSLRRQIYAVVIMVSAGLCLGRIFAVDNLKDRAVQDYRMSTIRRTLEEKQQQLKARGASQESILRELNATQRNLTKTYRTERPTLSANDRSRFCTIRALVEPDLRETRIVEKNGQKQEVIVPYAIDKIRTQQGWDSIDIVCHSLPDDPSKTPYLYSTKPPLLPTVMAVPYWIIYKSTGWTFTTEPFLVTRLMLIVCHLIPLVVGWILTITFIERFAKNDWTKLFAVAFTCFGTFLSTFVVTLNNHLPAVFCIIVALYAAVRIRFDGDTRKRWFFIAAFFSAFAFACELPSALFFSLLGLSLLIRYPRQTLIAGLPAAAIVIAAFFTTNYIAHKTFLPAYSKQSWYFFEGYQKYGKTINSYWSNPQGPDIGEPDRLKYAYHFTLGHHGVFALTPVWILAIIGLFLMLRQKENVPLRNFAIMTLFMTIACFAFYLSMEQENRNYGGMTSGLRWLFWLIPFWTLALLPTLDKMSKYAVFRGLALLLLLMSAVSVSYPLWNPWSPPWLAWFWEYLYAR